jgi:alkaline phosphatase
MQDGKRGRATGVIVLHKFVGATPTSITLAHTRSRNGGVRLTKSLLTRAHVQKRWLGSFSPLGFHSEERRRLPQNIR